MANATKDINMPDSRAISSISKIPIDAKAATSYFAGTVIEKDASGNGQKADGTGIPVGVLTKAVDNSTGAAGDQSLPCQPGIFPLASSGLTKANIGTEYKMADDQTVGAATPGGGIFLAYFQDGKPMFSVGLQLLVGKVIDT